MVPWLSRTASPLTCSMRRAIPYPCWGPMEAKVWRTIRSRVPWSRSSLDWVKERFLLCDDHRSMPHCSVAMPQESDERLCGGDIARKFCFGVSALSAEFDIPQIGQLIWNRRYACPQDRGSKINSGCGVLGARALSTGNDFGYFAPAATS